MSDPKVSPNSQNVKTLYAYTGKSGMPGTQAGRLGKASKITQHSRHERLKVARERQWARAQLRMFLADHCTSYFLSHADRRQGHNWAAQQYPVANCCRVKNPNAALHAVQHTGTLHSSIAGVFPCNNLWSCPTCAYRVMTARREELRQLFKACTMAGLYFSAFTLTTPHRRTDGLKPLRVQLQAAFTKLCNSRGYDLLMAEYGYRFRVRVLEVTRGDANGWHPHFHVALVTERPLPARGTEALAQLDARLTALWLDALTKAGLCSEDPQERTKVRTVGVSLDSGLESLDYLAKLVYELTSPETKGGERQPNPRKGLTAFQLATRAMEAPQGSPEQARDLALYREYATAMTRAQFLVMSDGAREFAGLDVAKLEDELERDATGETESWVKLGTLTEHWCKWLWSKRLERRWHERINGVLDAKGRFAEILADFNREHGYQPPPEREGYPRFEPSKWPGLDPLARFPF